MKEFDEFKKLSDVIAANKMVGEIKDVKDKIYTKDIFSRD